MGLRSGVTDNSNVILVEIGVSGEVGTWSMEGRRSKCPGKKKKNILQQEGVRRLNMARFEKMKREETRL